MKIVLVHNSYQHRGGEDVVFEQEKAMLERAGHSVVVFVRSNSEIREFTPIEQLALPINAVWAVGIKREFSRLLDRERPDVVHVHNTFVVISPSIYSACREHGTPVVQTLHNFRLMCPGALFFRDGRVCEDCVDGTLWNAVRHGCYRDSKSATAAVAFTLAWHRRQRTWQDSIDAYIALSAFARDKFIAAGFPADKVFVKPNFVDPDPGPRENAGAYALYVGRLSAEKGVSTLLRAWELLPAPLPLHIVGDGPERAALEAQVRARNISGVSFRGSLSRPDTFAAMKGARLTILPSTAYETFGMVIVESMACGTPVLCSRLGAMQEIVADQHTGLHFTPGDAEDLARKVAWGWRHPEALSAMGLAARGEYEKRYTARRNYALLMEIYEDAIRRAFAPVDIPAAAFAS
jgi:glycosyltransferase involved in cell wall biosynthesis